MLQLVAINANTNSCRLRTTFGLQKFVRLLVVFTICVVLLNGCLDGISAVSACELYMTKTLLKGAGRGIFAGNRSFEKDDFILNAHNIMVPRNFSRVTQLDNYVFGYDDPLFYKITLNYVCIVNHKTQINSMRFWNEPDSGLYTQRRYPDFRGSSINLVASLPIKSGEEIFLTYGESTWFSTRYFGPIIQEETSTEETALSVDSMQTKGVCLTDVDVKASTIPLGRKGLFAKRNFAVGEVVIVDPVLAIESRLLPTTYELTPMVNYCISRAGSAVSLMPLGLIPMINHQSGNKSNVRIDWFSWTEEELTEALATPIAQLLKSPYSLLDIKAVATKPIATGEEIFLDYGNDWQTKWIDYLSRAVEHYELPSHQVSLDGISRPVTSTASLPLFRQFIEAPDGLFPSHWFQ